MEIITGKISKPQRVVIYGPEGIGKSTFAAQFPDPLFIDTEGSTEEMDVKRLPSPSSWSMFVDQVNYVRQNPSICRTLIIDTADWAEKLCIKHVCAQQGKVSIEDFGYGKGYIYLAEEFGRMLNALSDLTERGVNVVLTAHAIMRKFEQPDESGAYDRWELKLEKKTSPLLKEWASMLLFANYKTLVIKKDDKTNNAKAKGGKRVLYTSHHPCWDAKNRAGLPEEVDFNFEAIRHVIPVFPANGPVPTMEQCHVVEAAPPSIMVEQVAAKAEEVLGVPVEIATKKEPEKATFSTSQSPLAQLFDLMKEWEVTREEIQWAVSAKGYYPQNTPLENYADEFIAGVLVGAWKQVKDVIIDKRIEGIPF